MPSNLVTAVLLFTWKRQVRAFSLQVVEANCASGAGNPEMGLDTRF